MSATLSLKNLRKNYGQAEVVAGLNLELAPGTCHGLLGPNGAGKTTTLRLALGLIEADAGSIELLGHRLPHEASQARMRVGVVPQADSLDPDFTVRENLFVFGRYFGISKREIEARLPTLLDFAGLAGKADTRIDALSGGMKRRLALARALVNDPDVIFLDEPTTGLDPQARRNFWDLIRSIKAEGRTVLLTTHYMEEAYFLCDVIVIMDRGRIIAEGPPSRLLKEHFDDVVLELPREDLPSDLSRIPLPALAASDRVEISTGDVEGALRVLLEHDVPLQHLRIRPRNLEDLFLELTGRELRT